MMHRTSAILRQGLSFDRQSLRDPQFMVTRFADIALEALLSFGPFILGADRCGAGLAVLSRQLEFSFKAVVPDLQRLDPVKGITRIVSWSGLLELVKGVAKASLIGGVAISVMWSEQE